MIRDGRHIQEAQMHYETPEVIDFGTLQDITEASGFVAEEDGGSKLMIHHESGVAGP